MLAPAHLCTAQHGASREALLCLAQPQGWETAWHSWRSFPPTSFSHTRGTQPRSQCLYSSFQQGPSEAVLGFPGSSPCRDTGLQGGERDGSTRRTPSPGAPAAPGAPRGRAAADGASGAAGAKAPRASAVRAQPRLQRAHPAPPHPPGSGSGPAGPCPHLSSEAAGIWPSQPLPERPWRVRDARFGRGGRGRRAVPRSVPRAGHGVTSERGCQERAGRAQAGKARGVKFPEPLSAAVSARFHQSGRVTRLTGTNEK